MDNKIEKLLEMDIITEDNKVIFTLESKMLIHEIAEECKSTEVQKANYEKGQKYGEDKTAEDLYIDMLMKIVNAPTRFHMMAVTRLLIPLIDDKLN